METSVKNLVIGLVVGVLVSAAVFYPLLKHEQKNQFNIGQSHGFVTGQWQAIEALEPYLNQVPPGQEVNILFSVKTSDIVVYEENGVKVIGLRK
jgi:4-amino-4-deoxy-L-arabinose transferase-like glycosyltransferase